MSEADVDSGSFSGMVMGKRVEESSHHGGDIVTHEISGARQLLDELREHADYHIDSMERQRNTMCESCKAGFDDKPLVNQLTWKRAKDIAEYIFPRLQSI